MPHPQKVSITKTIIFNSNEYSETPQFVKLEFTPETLHRIATIQCLIKQYNLYSVHIEIPDSFTLMDDCEKDGGEDLKNDLWLSSVETFTIYENAFYFYSQNKYDSADQIESEEISFEEINLLFKPI
jgi:hypothetical protein